MKQTIYNLGLLFIFLIGAINLSAQAGEQCNRDFEIRAKVTESTCMANGIIEVTLEGDDLSELELSMTEYALRPIDGTEGTSLQFTKNSILKGVAAGTYIVSVRTFCIEKAEAGVVTESRNVVVGGNYKPLMAEFDLSRMRNSYPNCATGLIAFNLRNGTGFGDLTFHLSKAPAGVRLGEVFPIKGSVVGGYTQYSLSELYASGDYQIDVYDSCSKATMTFTVGEVIGFPYYSVTFRRPNTMGISRNLIQLTGQSYPNATTYPDYYRYCNDRMYEIALVPADQTPTDSDWKSWVSSTSMDFEVAGEYKDYYAAQSLKTYMRVKDCNESMMLQTSSSLNYPYMALSSNSLACYDYAFTTSNYGDQDGFWSYPINIKITNTVDDIVIHDQSYATPPASVSISAAEYGKRYNILVTDAVGITNLLRGSNTSVYNSFSPSLYITSYVYNCNTFKFNVSPYYSTYNCYPVEMTVNKKNAVTGEFEHLLDHTYTSNTSISFEWEYGQYQLITTYVGHVKADGSPHTVTTNVNVASPRPTTLTISSSSSSSSSTELSNEHYGYLQIAGNATFPVGTRFTITDAPEGYRHIGKTLTSTSSSNYFYFGNSDVSSNSSAIYMPEGDYTVTVADDCGTNLTTTAYLITGYDAQNVKYIVEEDGCNGARIRLDQTAGGLVKLKGNPNASYTNFRIISGPSGGYETTLKRYNQDLQIVADGEYVIATIINSSYQYYYIRKDTIYFEKSKPTLKPSVTSAYVCTDPGATLGYIIFTGQGGKAPYAYELFDKDENTTGLTATGGQDERVVFNHGVAGETYIVRITDACGNSTTQEVTLADLKTQSIIYNIPPSGEYCAGETLKLNCVTLGQTTYLWEKKISEGVYEFVSNDQNPRISPATEAHSGVYRVTVTPEYCGEAITGELVVKVYPNLAAGAVSADQEICVATRASALSCVVTGGKGTYNYQWQVSTDQIAWADASNGATRTYTPLHTSSGIYYYRLKTTDDCVTVTSDVITVDVKPCYIMVNPNIRSVAR